MTRIHSRSHVRCRSGAYHGRLAGTTSSCCIPQRRTYHTERCSEQFWFYPSQRPWSGIPARWRTNPLAGIRTSSSSSCVGSSPSGRVRVTISSADTSGESCGSRYRTTLQGSNSEFPDGTSYKSEVLISTQIVGLLFKGRPQKGPQMSPLLR